MFPSEYSLKICISEVNDIDPAVFWNCLKIGSILTLQALSNPIQKSKRMFFVMLLSLLHHGTSSFFQSEAKTFKCFSMVSLITIILNWLKGKKQKKKKKEQPDNPISCDYCIISKFKKLKIKKQQDFPSFHFYISFSAHIGDFIVFLNLVSHKFNIIFQKVEFPENTHKQPIWTY